MRCPRGASSGSKYKRMEARKQRISKEGEAEELEENKM